MAKTLICSICNKEYNILIKRLDDLKSRWYCSKCYDPVNKDIYKQKSEFNKMQEKLLEAKK